jgi:hypothetical protein
MFKFQHIGLFTVNVQTVIISDTLRPCNLVQSLKGILLKCVCSVFLESPQLRFLGYSIGDFSNKTIPPQGNSALNRVDVNRLLTK